ncbi:hypothetical protein KJ359_002054 [Pestalotiopsis sp. 9143b]|nr:hypothetical protein KJ359_002054 [Pestalotiopsis sp. 9143b]
MPPSYGTQAYWDERFTKENHFEWLLPPAALTAPIRDALDRCAPSSPRILHIGCGSSDLSFHLRGLVASAAQVVNVDYSEVAIRKCLEQDKARRGGCDQGPEMVWKTADLLSPASVAALAEPRSAGARDGPGFDVIVDKSTSDCIACADDVKVDLPYQFRAPSADPASRSEPAEPVRSSGHAHPLHVISVNLAAMAKPATRWVCLSYSDDRFPFLGGGRGNGKSSNPADGVDGNLVRSGFPDPRALWRVEQKREIVAEDEEKPRGGGGGEARPYVHRPPTVHWLYTLVRTDQPL